MDKLRKRIKINLEKLLIAVIESLINLTISIITDFWIYLFFLLIILILGIWRLLWLYALKSFDIVTEDTVDVIQTILDVLNDAIEALKNVVDDIKNGPENLIDSL